MTSSWGCTLVRTEQGMEDQRDGRGCYEFVHLFLPIHRPMRSKIQQHTSQIIKASVRDWRRGPPHVVAGLWRGWGQGQESSFCSWININKRNLGTLHSWFKYCSRKRLPFWLNFYVFMETNIMWLEAPSATSPLALRWGKRGCFITGQLAVNVDLMAVNVDRWGHNRSN